MTFLSVRDMAAKVTKAKVGRQKTVTRYTDEARPGIAGCRV